MANKDDGGWAPIETAPKDGATVDLWIVGSCDMVDFHTNNTAKFNRKTRRREGIAEGWAWLKYGPNAPAWRCHEFPEMMPLSPEVTPTHWQTPRSKWEG